jgi:hypothetical protein
MRALERLRTTFLLAAAATVLAWARPADAAISVGATGTGTSAAGNFFSQVTTNWSTATTAGSLLVAVVTSDGTGLVFPSGWTQASSATGTNVTVTVLYIENAASQTSATVSAFNFGATPAMSLQLIEFKGMATSGSLDVTATNTASAAHALTVTPTSNTAAGVIELGFMAFAHDNDASGYEWGSAPSGFTPLPEIVNTTREISSYNTAVLGGTKLTEAMSVRTSGLTANMAGVVVSFKSTSTPMYWRGGATGTNACASGSNWTSTTCWATTSGGASSGAKPMAGDVAVFESARTGNCTINSAVSVGSIIVQSGYSGTITHSSGNISLVGGINFQTGATATFNSTSTSASSITTNQSGAYNGDLVLAAGTFTVSAAPIGLHSLTVGGGTFTSGSSAVTTNAAGTVDFAGGTVTIGAGGLSPTSTVTVDGATVSMGNAAFTAASLVTCSAGTMSFGSGNVAFGGGLTISGTGAVALGTGGTQTASTVAVSSTSASALTFSAGKTFSTTGSFSQSAGTVTMSSATLTLGTGTAIGSDGFTLTGGTFNAGTGTFNVTGQSGNSNSGATTTINGSGATFNGASGTQHFAGAVTVSAGTLSTGLANMSTTNAGNLAADRLVTVSAGGTMTLASSSGFAFSSTSTMALGGTVNAAGTTSFSGPVTLSGTFNAGSASTTFSGTVSMSTGSAFNGNTGSTTFSAAEPATALAGGTFTVGDSGTTGYVLFTSGASFAAPMTLAFPTSRGDLKIQQGQSLTVAGTVTSSAGTTSTKPKIECNGCTATQGVGMNLAGTLNIDGLELDNATTAGVTIASGATFTLFKNLAFKNNAGNSTSGTHLVMTLGTAVVNAPGCTFDGTATTNVSLHGTSGQNQGARAIFEYHASGTNGAGAGESKDDDGDDGVSPDAKKDDGLGGDTASPYFGSVVEWVNASPTDITGSAVAFPTAAFDWNTFAYYGVYASFKDTSGSSTADILWHRNDDGSAAYSFPVAQTSGDLIGTPYWDTVSENGLVDLDGNGAKTDHVHVVYLATTGGHIIKLVDTGTQLMRPANGAWTSDFTDSTVTAITSPLASDLTNLYFGGLNGTTANVYAVQIASGTTETKLLVKTKGPLVSQLNTTPTWATSSGSTYVFLGSTKPTSGNALIYRLNMSGTVDGSYDTGAAKDVNGAIVFQSNRVYAVSDAGKLYALDALNFATGGFTTVWTPYQTTAASPIKLSAWVGPDSVAFFGDNAGKVYDVTSSGTLATGYPVSVGSAQITSSPLYRQDSGVIAVGASDGYVYFIDRSAASVFKRFFVSASGTVSSVSYDKNIPAFMVSSSDGKLVFINAADVTDPTSSSI